MWKIPISMRFIRETRVKLSLLAIIAALSVASYAATVNVTTTTYQAQYGISYNITGNFGATDQGFQTVATTQGASTQPCSWTSGGNCKTALTIGHFHYQLMLNLVNVPAVATTYSVIVEWNQGSTLVTMGTLTVSVPSTATAGQTMTFQFDTGGSTFTYPLSIDVTVA